MATLYKNLKSMESEVGLICETRKYILEMLSEMAYLAAGIGDVELAQEIREIVGYRKAELPHDLDLELS